MDLSTLVVGGGTTNTLLVHPGEAVSLPITWNNLDGSARDMSLATVQFFLRDSMDVVVYTTTLTDAFMLTIPAAVTNGLAVGTYSGELAVTYLNREPDNTTFSVLVGGTLLQSTTLTIVDDSISAAPIPGVTVEVLDFETAAFVAYGVSDTSGICRLALPGDLPPIGHDYELRLYKAGVHFSQPYTLTVFDPLPAGATNEFTVTGALVSSFGIPSDELLCRCVGRFVDFSNKPIAKMPVLINAVSDPGLKVPKIVGGSAMASEAMRLRTDTQGYLVVDLPRSAEFRIAFAGESDVTWNFKVPDRHTANLIDLIYPQPVELVWGQTAAPDNTVTFAVGQTVLIPVSVRMSDFSVLTDDLTRFLTFTVQDSTVADGGYGSGITLTGMSVGTTTVVPTLSDASRLYPVRLPDYSPALPTLTIVVTA